MGLERASRPLLPAPSRAVIRHRDPASPPAIAAERPAPPGAPWQRVAVEVAVVVAQVRCELRDDALRRVSRGDVWRQRGPG